MPDPATQFQQAGLQGGQYWPVEYHPGNMQTLQPVTYGAITDALKTGLDEIKNSPLNPVVAEARRAQMAQLKTTEAEAGVNQQVLQDIHDHPENYQGLLGYKVGQGAEISATGTLANNWAAQNAGGGYGYKAPPPPAKTDGGGGGGGGQQKTAEQTQGGDELTAVNAYFTAHGLDPKNTVSSGGGLYSNGGMTIDASTAKRLAGSQTNTGNTQNQSNSNQPSRVAAGSGTTELPQNQTNQGGAQNQGGQQQQLSANDAQSLLRMYNQNKGAGAANGVTRQGNSLIFTNNGRTTSVESSFDYPISNLNAGGLVTSPFRPMAMAAPPPAPMFMQAGGPVPGGQAPGAMPQMPPGGAPQAPAGAVPPEQMQQWQNATQGNTASAKAALEWAQNNMDTAIKRAVLMRGAGPGGQDAYAFFGPKGGSNIVPVMQMMVHGFAPEIIAQNTTSHLSAAPQPATPPPAAPQGPIRMQGGGEVPDNQQANPQGDPNLPASPTNPGGFSVQGPLTGQQLAQLMNKPGAITQPSPDDAKNPLIQQVQKEANRRQSPIDENGGAAFHNSPDDVNITGKDALVAASNGEINSPLMARYLRTLIDNGELSKLPTGDDGNPIIKTLRNGTVIRADMSHNNGPGEPSGAPYISYGADPYHDVRLYAGMDHQVLHQNNDQELNETLKNSLGLPAAMTAGMSREAKLDLLYSKYRRENLPNLPDGVEKNMQDMHSMLQYSSRIADLINSMTPEQYDLWQQKVNEAKNVAGHPFLSAWQHATAPIGGLFGPSKLQGQDLTTINKNWSLLDQSHNALAYYIGEKANIDGTDKKFLLDSIGDPAINNIDYKARINQFKQDMITNYQIAVRKAEAQGFYVPQIYKDDMLYLDKHGRVLDPSWEPVTRTPAAAKTPVQEKGTEGTFPTVNWSRTPPQGVGQDPQHPWVLDGKSPDEIRYIYQNAAKGTQIQYQGKTFPLN